MRWYLVHARYGPRYALCAVRWQSPWDGASELRRRCWWDQFTVDFSLLPFNNRLKKISKYGSCHVMLYRPAIAMWWSRIRPELGVMAKKRISRTLFLNSRIPQGWICTTLVIRFREFRKGVVGKTRWISKYWQTGLVTTEVKEQNILRWGQG